MLPAKSKNSAPKKKSAFMRAIDRLKRERAGQYGADAALFPHGKGDIRTTMHRCAVSDQPFMIVWRRAPGQNRFAIYETEKLADEPAMRPSKPGEKEAAANFPVSEFNFNGQHCPWCSSARGFVICPCGENVCGGATFVRNGIEHFEHKKCGNSCSLSPANSMAASQSSPPAHKALPRKKPQPALPGKRHLIESKS